MLLGKKMLRQVNLLLDGIPIFQQKFAIGLDPSEFNNLWHMAIKDINFEYFFDEEIMTRFYWKYRIEILTVKHRLIIIFITDMTNSGELIKDAITECRNRFLDKFEDIFDKSYDPIEILEFSHDLVDCYDKLSPKISIVGHSGVGKTTITRLLQNATVPLTHLPTISGEVQYVSDDKINLSLWDFAGQEEFEFLWDKFLRGSDAVLIITDSTMVNVIKSRTFVGLIKRETPFAYVGAIANKQDLPDSLSPEKIKYFLRGVPVYPMIANKQENRDVMIDIVKDLLEISPMKSLEPLIGKINRNLQDKEAWMDDFVIQEKNAKNEWLEKQKIVDLSKTIPIKRTVKQKGRKEFVPSFMKNYDE
ncbi:hypothetical protein NEF87_002927 [Candidatus Lokiarchaeum ossiferum]|uniref:GTP-binding protein n=1 Tax=Candidatus Lokiarchaeum ossiferum TaxID=2951803 RepID=A0ABY6HWB0_9ARCH|nr:hypothetical protein NEF87_002927 [Candidatus Lokiarchaeum sp. B-35]